MPAPVIDAIKRHIDLEARLGGYEAQEQASEAISNAYRSIARLLNTNARNIAFTENATASYAAALSSIPLRAGDVILTTRQDYASNQIQFLSLQKRFGIEIVRAPDRAEGGVDTGAMAQLIGELRPVLVCVTEVPTNSGLVQDVRAVGEMCGDAGITYLVDACQSVGQLPVDVQRIRCDFLSATSRKFLRGPRGSGFLYVSDRMLDSGYEPLFIDMHGADWVAPDRYRVVDSAKRFENWEFACAVLLGTGAAVDYALEVGIDVIRQRVDKLASELREGLAGLPGVSLLDRGATLCGIVTLSLSGHDPFVVVSRLRELGINTSAQAREYAVIDYDDKGVGAALRISPHYYNTEQEIERVIGAIADL